MLKEFIKLRIKDTYIYKNSFFARKNHLIWKNYINVYLNIYNENKHTTYFYTDVAINTEKL